MKQLLTIPVLCLTLAVQLSGQTEIFEGLFGKEEPVFHTTFTPASEEGTVKMAFHFTHPSLDNLEASFWVKDLGANLMGGGEKKLVKGLQEYGNRKQSEIIIEGLKNRHFYAIGIDFRGASALSRKFSSKVLEESFRYEYKSPEKETAQAQAARPPAQQFKAPEPAPAPCEQPSLFIKIEPAGYCGAANRPAVLLQCDNCQGKPWTFSVEARTEFGQWLPLRADGKKQQALGVAPRTEPLCTLEPGDYYFRVLAWGENCSSPIIQAVATPVHIPGKEEQATPLIPSGRAPKTATIPSHLPDTCIIESEAVLEGNLISGFIELDPSSPCSAYNPFAKVRYVHPGYRDITIGQVALVPGKDVEFKVRLDNQDLSRGIHPLQVVVCIRPKGTNKDIPISSFWIRAELTGDYRAPELAREESPADEEGQFEKWMEEQAAAISAEPAAQDAQPSENIEAAPPEMALAGASGCQQLQGLQLIYSPDRPDRPLYISWENPPCCQEEGCEYMIWAGAGPGQLKLLVKGRKAGANVREWIQGAEEGAAYYEVTVRTPGGIRKAAYRLGEGPKYGDEAEKGYSGAAGESLVTDQEYKPGAGIQVTGGLANRTTGMALPASSGLRQPTHPITDFEPCRIFRATQVIANKPIQDGDKVTIEYDFNDKSYRYSLYHLPEGAPGWVIAPGTREFQPSPAFDIQAQPQYSGKYLVLAIKEDQSWGCLSAPIDEPIEIQVLR